MDSRHLYPPNIYGLSDNVIGTVHTMWNNGSRPQERNMQMQLSRHDPGTSQHRRLGCENSASILPGVPSCEHTNQITTADPVSKWSGQQIMSTSVTRALQSIAILQASGIYLDANQQRAIMEDVLRKKDRHRFLQASYKKQKQISMEEDEQHVRRLRHEIKELQLQAEAISSGTQIKLNHGAIAKRYEHHFRCFVSDVVRQKTAALGFLLCIMAPDAASNPRYGAEAVLENWRRLSEYFGDIQLEISDLSELAAADVLVATTTTSIVLSDKTLRLAFPHLNSDRVGGLEGGEWSPTAIQLLGKKFVLHGSIQFDLDYASNRVTRIETQADMLSPILHILGNLESVDQVFDGAVVTPDFGMIGKD
ncbi:hypothetical protein ON010_g4107 [Phytophthora cinnamomi]|nr:hypothetical protein ON010_g4107 [Phytophthora cinnamomi]